MSARPLPVATPEDLAAWRTLIVQIDHAVAASPSTPLPSLKRAVGVARRSVMPRAAMSGTKPFYALFRAAERYLSADGSGRAMQQPELKAAVDAARGELGDAALNDGGRPARLPYRED